MERTELQDVRVRNNNALQRINKLAPQCLQNIANIQAQLQYHATQCDYQISLRRGDRGFDSRAHFRLVNELNAKLAAQRETYAEIERLRAKYSGSQLEPQRSQEFKNYYTEGEAKLRSLRQTIVSLEGQRNQALLSESFKKAQQAIGNVVRTAPATLPTPSAQTTVNVKTFTRGALASGAAAAASGETARSESRRTIIEKALVNELVDTAEHLRSNVEQRVSPELATASQYLRGVTKGTVSALSGNLSGAVDGVEAAARALENRINTAFAEYQASFGFGISESEHHGRKTEIPANREADSVFGF